MRFHPGHQAKSVCPNRRASGILLIHRWMLPEAHAWLLLQVDSLMHKNPVQSVCCSGRGPKFSSQDPHGNSQPSVKLMPFWPQQASGMFVMYVHTCRQNTHEVKIDESFFLKVKNRGHICTAIKPLSSGCWALTAAVKKLNENLPFLEGLTRTCSSSPLWREVALSLQTVAYS